MVLWELTNSLSRTDGAYPDAKVARAGAPAMVLIV